MPRKTERARVSKAKKVKPAERPGSHPTPSETNSATETKVSPRPRTTVPIVAIGASAGGLEALELFFEAMGPESGAAFVIIQHLSPDFPSVMDELLARRTRSACASAPQEADWLSSRTWSTCGRRSRR